jgi:hypothetical protein
MERDVLGRRHWVHNTAGEDVDNFEEAHLELGIGETGIGKIIIRDSTNFGNINYDELYIIAKGFIENGLVRQLG